MGFQPRIFEVIRIILMLTQLDTDYLVVDDRLAFVVSDRMTVPKILLVDLLVELV
jgi:hypothetical protein